MNNGAAKSQNANNECSKAVAKQSVFKEFGNSSKTRYYCDKCLGYGTCQDCGKSIDSDRLYCDKCLGYGTCQDCGKKISDNRKKAAALLTEPQLFILSGKGKSQSIVFTITDIRNSNFSQ